MYTYWKNFHFSNFVKFPIQYHNLLFFNIFTFYLFIILYIYFHLTVFWLTLLWYLNSVFTLELKYLRLSWMITSGSINLSKFHEISWKRFNSYYLNSVRGARWVFQTHHKIYDTRQQQNTFIMLIPIIKREATKIKLNFHFAKNIKVLTCFCFFVLILYNTTETVIVTFDIYELTHR